MKTSTRAFGLTLLTFVLANPCAFSQDPVSIVYPRQHMLLSTVDSTIVLGRILLKGASLQINGQLIRASPDGAFLDFISIPPDSVRTDSIFALHCVVTRLDTTVSFVRTVRVPIERPPLDTIALEVDPLYLCFPADSVWLNSGEVLPLRVRASPGRSVSVRIMNGDGTVIDSQLALLETESGITDDFGDAFMGISKPSSRPKIPGLYETSYTLRAGINYRNARCLATVSNHTTGLTRGVSGTLNTYGPPRTVEITAELANVRNRPGRAYTYFLPQGVRCVANGRIGQQIRLNLSKANEGWISRDQIKELSSGHPEPSSLIPVVRVEKTEKGSTIKFIMSERLPFLVRQNSLQQLELLVFGGVSDTDWIRFINKNRQIKNVQWRQIEPSVYSLTVWLREEHHWGYSCRYDGTNLIWTIREKPESRGLKGLTVCVDPGHSPDIGATGPRGTQERQVNMETALALKNRLEREGARVVLTHRDTSEGVSLTERAKIANAAGADAFVSIHHNATPDAVNPFSQLFGPSVIYYHAQSKRLADKIQKELVKRTKLPDFGVFQGNISVCRNPEMPAVLVECAFLIHPDQEQLSTQATFQRDVARAITDGLKKFFK